MSEPDQVLSSDVGGQQWLDKAADDLGVAELVLGSANAALWAACFHAQQAAEKALKAVLVARGIDFPRTHTLARLALLLGADAGAFDQSELDDLTPWAVAGRYPEDVPEPSRQDAMRLVGEARSVVEIARRQITSGTSS